MGLAMEGLFDPAGAAAPCGISESVILAAAQGLANSGVAVVTCVPATGAAAIFDCWRQKTGRMSEPYSFHEEVAFTMAHGAALTGVRSATIIKSHGLAKAANSCVDALTMGVTAGFLILVVDDREGRHSDTIFDLDAMLTGLGLPWRRPEPAALHRELVAGMARSEAMGLPVAVVVEAADLEQKASLLPEHIPATSPVYRRDPYFHVLCPPLAKYQHALLQARLAGREPHSVPRPRPLIIPESLPPLWRSGVESFLPLFEVFAGQRREGDFVSGDTGLSTVFAFEPFEAIDATSYFGGSGPLALGALLAGRSPCWAVTGDFSFLAAGLLALPEAVLRGLPLKVLICYNGCAAATGGQPIPQGMLGQTLGGFSGQLARIRNPADKAEVAAVLAEAQSSPELRIVVAEFVAP